MIRYVIKRLLMMILVSLGVILFVFIVSRASGDPVVTILEGNYTQEQYDLVYHQMGFDRPQIVQFIDYIVDVLHGDLGQSYHNKASIWDEIMFRFPDSIRIAVCTLIWAVPVGLCIGIVSAVKQYSKLDYTLTTVAMILDSLPGFWVALMLMLIFSLKLKLVPATGVATWRGYILPCVALGLRPMAHMARLSRSSMLEVIRQDYIRTARSKGLGEKTVIFKHALQNAALPLITQIGSNFATIVGSSAVIENIFMIPGLGNYLAMSISNRDYPAIQGTVLVFSIFVSFVNLLVDICFGFVDPRIKAKYANTTSLKDKIKMWKLAKEKGVRV